jgi:hypothetical protein
MHVMKPIVGHYRGTTGTCREREDLRLELADPPNGVIEAHGQSGHLAGVAIVAVFQGVEDVLEVSDIHHRW